MKIQGKRVGPRKKGRKREGEEGENVNNLQLPKTDPNRVKQCDSVKKLDQKSEGKEGRGGEKEEKL